MVIQENDKYITTIEELEEIANRFDQTEGFNRLLSEKYNVRKVLELTHGTSVLELGCGEGLMTQHLTRHFEQVVAVDGSQECIYKASQRVSGATLQVSLIEQYVTGEKFDNIIIAHLLEHVDDPVAVLNRAKQWLKPDGVIIIIVPNAESLHRQIGLRMGIIQTLHELSEADHNVGHKRYYDIGTLNRDIFASGLNVDVEMGILVKPFTNERMQVMATLNDGYVDALYDLSEKMRKYCAEICVRCIL